MTKKYIAFFIFIIVLLVVGYKAFYIKQDVSPINLSTFNGELISIDNDKITLRGMFVSSSTLPENLQGQQELVFRVDKSTQYRKLEIKMPSYESLRAKGKTSGSYEISDLPRVEGVSSIEELKSFIKRGDVYLQVNFPYSIYNKKNPTASFIFFQVLIEPTKNI